MGMPSRNSFGFLVAAAAVVAGYFFWQNYRLTGLEDIRIEPRKVTRQTLRPPTERAALGTPARATPNIRIASFNLQAFGETKLGKPHVIDVIARIIRQYDIVAIQEVRSRSQDALPRLVDAVNASGAQYDFVIGPRLGRTSSKEQYAFVFDRATVEVDRNQTYTVEDPDDVLHREPLVAWFRVRGPPTSEAFTFSLVNIHVDPDDVRREVNVLDDIFRAVRNDGREEDDVILVGDLNTDDRHLGQLGQSAAIVAAISGVPTTVRGSSQLDNILFDGPSTKEFTGRAGVFDFLREYNFTLEQALEISDHLPVWAEFSAFEGGLPGQVAGRADRKTR